MAARISLTSDEQCVEVIKVAAIYLSTLISHPKTLLFCVAYGTLSVIGIENTKKDKFGINFRFDIPPHYHSTCVTV